jgi:mono/diheme cytochrome c family protein
MLKKVFSILCCFIFAMTLTLLVSDGVDAADYIGAKKCKACHMKQFKAWQKTNMATSFENLKPGAKAEEKTKAGLDPNKDYTTDKDCLRCHTTGYGKPGGFVSLEATPNLINVQCESCHGPGADFRKIMKKNKKFKLEEVKAAGLLVPSETENNCMECHGGDSPFNESVDPKYKFEIKERLENTHEHFPLKYEH